VTLDYQMLRYLRERNPAWRLLCSDHAALIAAVLNRAFIVPNVRVIGAATLAEALADEMFAISDLDGTQFPQTPIEYLNDWASPSKGWLRSFYKPGTDEQQFDLMPSTEKVLAWLASLTERGVIGTESRLRTVFDLLKQMSEGSETDPAKRMKELERRREEIDVEIARVRRGEIPVLDDVGLKDRFQQVQQLVRSILTDFREVEQNIRQLDRQTRERIAAWAGSKGELLDEVMGERDAITDSDQGRSFRAFWEFLLAGDRQEELSQLLEKVLELPAITELAPDPRMRRIHYDWLEAGEHTQRTVAQLSKQLRRFLDDRAYLDNRRIMDILRNIETRALELRTIPPEGPFISIITAGADISLALERPLHRPKTKLRLADMVLEAGEADIDTSPLFDQVVVDVPALKGHVRRLLEERAQVTLREIVANRPLELGLAELVAYLSLGDGVFRTRVDEDIEEEIVWTMTGTDGVPVERRAHLPRIIYVR
jgi:flagellar motility protein MotE (MotC chaperone)